MELHINISALIFYKQIKNKSELKNSNMELSSTAINILIYII